MSQRTRFAELYDIFAAMPQKRDELSEELTMISIAIADLVTAKKSDSLPPRYYYTAELAREAASAFSLGRLVSLYGMITRTLDDVSQSNANIRSVLAMLPYKIKSI